MDGYCRLELHVSVHLLNHGLKCQFYVYAAAALGKFDDLDMPESLDDLGRGSLCSQMKPFCRTV